MPAYKNVTLSAPLLSPSQVRFRLELARQRTRCYPLDSMDFIMMDLERPEGHHRHAYQCTGDLTGRMLEFLSHAEGVDGTHEPRLPELFERILRQRRSSGLFGKINDSQLGHECLGAGSHIFQGLVRYHVLTRDGRALDAAIGLAENAIRHKDIWYKRAKEVGGRSFELWITEPMAMLYGILGRQEYLDFAGMIAETVEMPDRGAHAHGYLVMLRGLQTAALITGDAAWNAKPEATRRMIIERHYELADGCVPECFPHSGANEGCSIADWLILNLNTAAITGDADAYARAEHILWNALAFNQWITGSFGHRSTSPAGYSMRRFEEAWWCCLHNGGLALAEYARHAVTFRDGAIQVNLLVPGLYRLAMPGGREAEVRIETAYPERAGATVTATGVPEGVSVRLRVPACARQASVAETRDKDRVQLSLSGRLGHHVVSCHGGVTLQYGPLVVAPSIYGWAGQYAAAASESHVPTGYIPEAMPTGLPVLELPAPDADGLLTVSELPRPDWMYFDEGPASRFGVAGSAANVPLRFPDGTRKTLRFTPLCYGTSCLSLFDTPIVFDIDRQTGGSD